MTDTFTSHENHRKRIRAILKLNNPLHVTKVVISSTILQVSTSIRIFSQATVYLNILLLLFLRSNYTNSSVLRYTLNHVLSNFHHDRIGILTEEKNVNYTNDVDI